MAGIILDGYWKKRARESWPSPHLTARLLVHEPLDIELDVEFMIDTGASDVMILAKEDIERLVGMGLRLRKLRRVEDITGVGGKAVGRAILNASLAFETQGVEPKPLPLVILVPRGPEGLPNLLGRSFLSQFELLLNNKSDIVRLTELS